jgi:hypothetical protein
MFTKEDLTRALADVGSNLGQGIKAYLIGGCAMTFMGRKVATKDIDVVFAKTRDAKRFVTALKSAGFKHAANVAAPYRALGAFAIMENSGEMRFDLYDRQVCKALELSQGMKTRAKPYQKFVNLQVFLMAPEDIFLFKGITEREADLDDMRTLAEGGLDWKTIEKECFSQKRSARWSYMLGTKLLDLRAKFSIESPIIKTLVDHADLALLVFVFDQIIGRDERSFNEIYEAIKDKYRYSESWTRKQIRFLVLRGVIIERKVGRRRFYHIKKIRARTAQVCG